MRKMIFSVVVICFIFTVTSYAQQPVTVKYVDLQKYKGLWYEIAKIPNKFQKHCISNTTASYSIDEDGDIKVINKCKDDEGEFDSAEGTARIVDKKTNSKLEVSFVSLLGFNLFWGDYWIIGLDDNYKWAVIGTPDKKYGWILSRSTEISDDTFEKINTILKSDGYNPQSFIKTKH